MRIAHLSDLHAGARDVSHETLTDMFLAVAEERVDVCAITGDLSESGEVREYDMLRPGLVMLQSTGIKVAAVPGNHDVAWRGVGGYDDQRCASFDDLPSNWYGPAWPRRLGSIYGLNSSLGQRGERIPSLARGEIGKLQMARLKALGYGMKDVLLLHHHPLWLDALHVLEDHATLVPIVVAMGFRVCLFGHQHVPFRKRVGETWFIAAGSTTRERWFEIIDLNYGGTGTLRITKRHF